MTTQRIAADVASRRLVRSEAASPLRALCGVCGALVLTLLSVWAPDRASARPVSPLALDRAVGISGAAPWVSPTGEQLVTYLRQRTNGTSLPMVMARNGGARFGSRRALSPNPAMSAPVLGFGPDGSARIAWQGSPDDSEQALRPAGRRPQPPAPVGDCRGPVAFATSSDGRTLSACRAGSGEDLLSLGVVGVGQMPSPLAPETGVTPAVEEFAGDPRVAWGTDGTGIVAFGYREGDPAEWKIAAGIVGADGNLGETEIVDSVTDPATLVPTGVAVLPNGTAAITANSDEGALLFTRPPGPDQSFERTEMDEDTASMPAADRWGRLHFLTSTTGDSGRKTWSSRVLDTDGTLRPPVRVPTRSTAFEPVRNGFQVFPSGEEALVMKSARGFSVFFRKPGPTGFFLPTELARTRTVVGPGSLARTPAGDLLVTWEERVSSRSRRVMLGGWDASGGPVVRKVSFPRRARRAARIELSVLASDTMGISRVVWKFPGNRKVEGASVKVRLWKPGVNRIQVSVIDRAGNRTERIRRIRVFEPRRPANQGRAGTSGSPRP